ncbi:VOC family protein [Ideonella sp. YS5]|uniref:VOC family protein n=1 Tax=Ideonella sp. YS5 TaxID=3453714 RepID=UPI003EEA5ADB
MFGDMGPHFAKVRVLPPFQLVMNLVGERVVMKLNALMVRYIVDDVEAAVAFYTRHLNFSASLPPGPDFALLARENLQLVLSPTKGPGGGSQPMPDGRRPEPGGWNRMIVKSSDLEGDIAALKKAGVKFRNDIVAGPGGRQILIEDPSGNLVELFEPAAAAGS